MRASSKALKASIIGGLSAAAIFASTTGAYANGGNWSAQYGPSGQGCFAWTNWTSDHVTGHIYSQSGDSCAVWILQWWRGNPGGGWENGPFWTTGSGTVASTPSWYYGPASGGYLCVEVYAADESQPGQSGVYYGDGCP